MNREKFMQQQPLAFQAINNSIAKKQFAHAYLLYGNEGIELQQYAEFLIQSLLCEQPLEGLACGTCSNCCRVAQGSYGDLVSLSGVQKRIGKAEILELMNRLNKTGLESKGLKFYLINEVDNATSEALNSLLKFLEEPGGESTFAVLTTHQIDKVLPTITSRCLKVPFWGYKKEDLLQDSSDKIADHSEYYLVSNIAKNPEKAVLLGTDEIFAKALNVFRNYLEIYKSNSHEALVVVLKEGLNDKKSDKEFLSYWLALNIQFFKDLNYYEFIPWGWYRQLIESYENYREKSFKMLPIFLATYDQLDRPLNMSLLTEKLFWQLQEVTT